MVPAKKVAESSHEFHSAKLHSFAFGRQHNRDIIEAIYICYPIQKKWPSPKITRTIEIIFEMPRTRYSKIHET